MLYPLDIPEKIGEKLFCTALIITFGIISILSLAMLFATFFPISGFPWALATMILFSFSATACAVMLSTLITSPTTSIQITLVAWLGMCATPLFFPPNPFYPTELACLQSFLPPYALHYIFKYCVAVCNYDVGSWTELANSRWTGQATIGPLLILAFEPILMIGIAYIFETKLWRKIWKICSKKIQKSDKSPESVPLTEADEKFDVDESGADIVLKNVYKKYPSGVKAVNGLDMMALRGQVTVLLGHNGAGKTTTFSIICGVEEASSGTVEIGGYPAGSLESRQIIGYCAQVNTLIDQMTVKDHLWLAHGLKGAEGKYWDEGEKLLTTLGLEDQQVKELSGGQKRKLCVAMALIGNSRVVLLDEPTAGMDPESRRDVEKLLEEVKKERTILLTTHYMDEAETLGDRIFIMADGHGVCSGSPHFLKKRPRKWSRWFRNMLPVQNWEKFVASRLFAMLLLYYWAAIPIVFIVSRFVKSSSQGALLLWVVLFGGWLAVVLPVTMYSMSQQYEGSAGKPINPYEGDPSKMSGLEIAFLFVRLLSPSYTIVELLSAYIQYSNGALPGQATTKVDMTPLWVMHCVCLAINGALGLLFFLLVQQYRINHAIFRMWTSGVSKRIPQDAVVPQDSVRNQPDGPAILETVDMSKIYGKKCALAHLNLSVRTHEIFGLLGISGAGKTTAFNNLTGQMFATKGTATIDGVDYRKKAVGFSLNFGICFQTLGFCPQFDAIHQVFTGREALTLLARIHGYTAPKRTADKLLDIVKMTEHGKKRMSRCSGGQKRRISVAASLLTTKSRIIILDEATAGIDPKARRDIWEVISAARNHAAVLMTSHSMDECEALCNRIGILKQGGLAIVGTSQSLKSRYGNFYTLTIALPSPEMKTKVTEEVAAWFPGSILKSDGFSLHLKWQVPKKATDRWSTVFASCIQLSERIEVADFCLTQSTLQDIFLLLAGDNLIPLNECPALQQTPDTTKRASATATSKRTVTGNTEKTDKLQNIQETKPSTEPIEKVDSSQVDETMESSTNVDPTQTSLSKTQASEFK